MRIFAAAALAGALLLSACNGASKAPHAPDKDDLVMGKADAPITVIEYASASCAHCARFNEEVFPQVKAKYIDTGQVRWVLREILTAPENVSAAGFLTARCAGPDKAFSVLDAIFRDIVNIVQGDARTSLQRIALSAGMTQQQFEACIADDRARNALEQRVRRNSIEGQVAGTPTFWVAGKKLGGKDGGEQTLAQLDAAIAAAKSGGDPAAAADKLKPTAESAATPTTGAAAATAPAEPAAPAAGEPTAPTAPAPAPKAP